MKFGIDIGHNCPHDTGAVGIKKEDELTKEVGTLLMRKLAAAGHSVINCTPTTASSLNDSLRQRVDKANDNDVDVFVSIHFNKFNGQARGTEIFALSKVAQAIARSVLKEIVNLGFKNRGVKDTGFFVIKHTSMPAILIECCFCDSQTDMALFNAEKMAEAIKHGLIGESDDNDSPHQPAILQISQSTILKPSTEQGANLSPETLANIAPGSYPVLDFRYEERHFWVKWPDKSWANRDEHFVFEEFGTVVEKP